MNALVRIRENRINLDEILDQTDELTGIKSQYRITKYIDDQSKNVHTKQLSLFLIVLENYENINYGYGKSQGDKAIIKIAEKLIKYQSDTVKVGRFGKNKFLVVLKNILDLGEAELLMREIRKSIDNIVFIDKRKIHLDISTERAYINCSGMYHDDISVTNIKLSNEFDAKAQFQRAIKEAYRNKEFHLNYQPYFHARTSDLIGYEALIRWDSKILGQVSPYKLITAAEEMGLINDIGEWVFREAVIFSMKVNKNRANPIMVSVNLSAAQLMSYDIYDSLTKIIEEINANPEYICLEMTETIMMSSIEVGINVIDRLKDFGFSISLDDFGTGYSSLSYFKYLPANILKLDKCFIDNIEEEDYDYDIVEAVIKLAHRKGLKVIAEGVESAKQVEILKSLNCDMIQGYYYGKPMCEDEIFNSLYMNTNNE